MSEDFQAINKLDLYSIIETKMKNEKNWDQTVILNVHNEYLEVSQIDRYVSNALMIGDNLECRIINDDRIIIMDTLVYNIKLVSNSIVLKILKVQGFDNLRHHKRYEVSFSATFHKKDGLGEKYAVVINLSLSGMCIITRDSLVKDDVIEIHLKYPGGKYITTECSVIWVTQSDQSYFCGLLISNMDDINKTLYKKLIKNLQGKEKRKKEKLEKEVTVPQKTGDE